MKALTRPTRERVRVTADRRIDLRGAGKRVAFFAVVLVAIVVECRRCRAWARCATGSPPPTRRGWLAGAALCAIGLEARISSRAVGRVRPRDPRGAGRSCSAWPSRALTCCCRPAARAGRRSARYVLQPLGVPARASPSSATSRCSSSPARSASWRSRRPAPASATGVLPGDASPAWTLVAGRVAAAVIALALALRAAAAAGRPARRPRARDGRVTAPPLRARRRRDHPAPAAPRRPAVSWAARSATSPSTSPALGVRVPGVRRRRAAARRVRASPTRSGTPGR